MKAPRLLSAAASMDYWRRAKNHRVVRAVLGLAPPDLILGFSIFGHSLTKLIINHIEPCGNAPAKLRSDPNLFALTVSTLLFPKQPSALAISQLFRAASASAGVIVVIMFYTFWSTAYVSLNGAAIYVASFLSAVEALGREDINLSMMAAFIVTMTGYLETTATKTGPSRPRVTGGLRWAPGHPNLAGIKP